MQESQLLVDAKQAAKALGISERTFHGLRSSPEFPQPVALLGPRIVRFRVADLQRYVASLPAREKELEPERLKRGRVYKSGQPVAQGGADAAA